MWFFSWKCSWFSSRFSWFFLWPPMRAPFASSTLSCTVNCEVEAAAAELSDSGFCFGYQTRKEKENSSGSVLLHSGRSFDVYATLLVQLAVIDLFIYLFTPFFFFFFFDLLNRCAIHIILTIILKLLIILTEHNKWKMCVIEIRSLTIIYVINHHSSDPTMIILSLKCVARLILKLLIIRMRNQTPQNTSEKKCIYIYEVSSASVSWNTPEFTVQSSNYIPIIKIIKFFVQSSYSNSYW